MLGKPCLRLPAGLVRGALALLHPLGLAPYGPEQVSFLRYRPVLDNRRLKEEFGFIPRHGSMAAFERHARARGLLHG
jgi:UDP-glucose 4-epimerase